MIVGLIILSHVCVACLLMTKCVCVYHVEGSGALTLPDGHKFEGEFKDDVPVGKGTTCFARGDVNDCCVC